MARTIVVGYDGSEHARDALALAARLCEATDATAIAVDVYPHDRWEIPPPGFSEWETFMREDAEQALTKALDLEPRPRQLQTRALAATSVPHGLSDVADEAGADYLALGASHRARLGQALAGSVALRLLQGAPCPVAVAPKGYRERELHVFGDLVVGYDGSAEAGIALRAACDLAAPQARVRVVGIVEPMPVHPIIDVAEARRAIAESMQRMLDAAIAELPGEIAAEPVLLWGDPAAELAQLADGADLLLVGSRGYGPLRRVLLGTVSGALVRDAPCPIVVFPRGAAESR